MKKQYMNYMKSCLLVMIACLVSMVGAAQGFSPAAMEQLKTRRLWSHSQNAAGMPFDDIQNYSNVILGYDLQDGNYCRPQEGQKEAIVGVSSEGFINLKNAYVWGAFNFAQKNLPQILTFPTCPHCRHQLSSSQITSFSTRGNQSFYNLIKTQFEQQPAVSGKDNDPERLPNEGRKVLLFSDSRQRAAKLARDMSDSSDIMAARQLFALAIHDMEQSVTERSMNELYDYFCLAAGRNHVQIFHEPEREKLRQDCEVALSNLERSSRRHREYTPRFSIVNAPDQMKKDLLRLFAGGYNTLYDSATSWIEPTEMALVDSTDELDENYGNRGRIS